MIHEMDLNRAFKYASKFIFDSEIGDMHDYETYLKEAVVGKFVESIFSGDRLFVTSDQYSSTCKFFNYEKENEKANQLLSRPISINEIKDMDSLLNAVSEKFLYSGAKVLGNSLNVTNSDNIMNCSCVENSSMLVNCRYIAYSYASRNSEYVFGATSSGDSSWTIRCFYNNRLQRCFECCASVSVQDCYFCYNIRNCHDCLFTFNTSSKNYSIANISLEKNRYFDLKKKLMQEMLVLLERDKKLNFSVLNLEGIV